MPKQQNSLTHSDILHIAVPMIMANISTPLLGMVDTAVVGHLESAHYLGSVAIGTLIFSFLFWGFGFLRMATTGLTAQALGSGNPIESQQVLQQSLLLAVVIAAIILIFQHPVSLLSFYFFDSGELVSQHANIYFDIRIWSAPATLINYVILGWLIGKEATRAALLMVLLINISNIILDIILVNIIGMNVDGVALASVISEYMGLMLGVTLLVRHGINLKTVLFQNDNTLKINTQNWLHLHSNIFIRTLCLMFCFAFFTAQGAKQGTIILAANAVLLNFMTLMAFVLDGFANATEVITGKAIGKHNKKQLRQGLLLTGYWSFIIACLCSLSYLLFGSYLITLLTDISEVTETANHYLIWLIIAPIIAVWSYLFDGLFVGATRSVEMRNTMLFATFFCFFPSWFLLQPLGNHGLWLALLIFLASRALGQAFYLPRILRLTVRP
ncbi:MAG: MATE family efflux transporter [Gammaproteobacteria bacterium]|nr:MATE family efflux transporter [Gammaproteobacteria bacterium]